MIIASVEELTRRVLIEHQYAKGGLIAFSSSVGILTSLLAILAVFRPQLIRKLPYLGPAIYQRKLLAVLSTFLILCASTFGLWYSSNMSPEAAAEQLRYYFKGMSERVTQIDLNTKGHDNVPMKVSITDEQVIARFSQLISESVISDEGSSNTYTECTAEIILSSGEIFKIPVYYLPISSGGVQFRLLNPGGSGRYELIWFRNDEVGRLFAEALGFEIR